MRSYSECLINLCVVTLFVITYINETKLIKYKKINMDIKAMVDDMNQMVLGGKILDAFEKYYADDVVMQDINMEPVVGKDANREREQKWISGITEFRCAEVKNVAVGDNVSMVEWFMDYSHNEYGDVKLMQVAVQTWRNDKIVKEVFYHA